MAKKQTSGKIFVPQPEQRRATCLKLAAHYNSLPSVLCCDFFAQLGASLAARPLPAGCKRARRKWPSRRSLSSSASFSSFSSTASLASFAAEDSQFVAPGERRAHSPKGSSGKGPPEGKQEEAGGRRRRRVQVFCRFREVDPKSGRSLVRRQLSRVREEDQEEEEEEEEEEEGGPLDERRIEFDPGDRLGTQIVISSRPRNQLDFDSFLDAQQEPSRSSGGRRLGANQSTSGGKSRSAGSRGVSGGRQRAALEEQEEEEEEEEEVACFELFCFHKSDLVVHKAQVSIEAEQLARRLARLCATTASLQCSKL